MTAAQRPLPVEAPQRDRYASLKVAIISDAESERNGVGAYYHDLVDLLRGYVQEIELICPGYADIDQGLKFPLPGDATQHVWLPPFRTINAHIRKLDPDIIIVPTPGPFGLFGAHLAKKHNASLIVGFHTHFEKIMDLYWSRWFGYLTVSYFELLNRFLFKRSQVILANSEEMVQVVRSRSNKPVELMGTPISKAFLTRPTIPPNAAVQKILFAGRLAAEKNISAYIAAAETLPALDFSIAGDGPIRAEIESAAHRLPNLHYLGWQSRNDLLQTLDNADMLVLPSHVESFGTIAMEAMARGKLVLVSSHCGILEWDALKPGLFSFSDEEALAHAIQSVIQTPEPIRLDKSKQAIAGAHQLSQWNRNNWLRLLSKYAVKST